MAEPTPTATENGEVEEAGGVPWVIIAAGLAAIALVLFIGLRVVGVLYALVFPPTPPVPPNVTEIRHEDLGYGGDEWVYNSLWDVCDVVDFYELAGTCDLTGAVCNERRSGGSQDMTATLVATCDGLDESSAFGVRWTAEIFDRSGQAQIYLISEVQWAAE